MSRGAAARRRRAVTAAEPWLAVCGRVEEGQDGREQPQEPVERLRDELAEVEGWYRLLREEHTALEDNERRSSRRTTELQTEVNRLESENQDLRALVEAGPGSILQGEDASMMRFHRIVQGVRRHKWAVAALMTITTLVARDPGVRDLVASATEQVRHAVGSGREAPREAADNGFLRYAALVNSREQAEQARREYNENEGTLKGDALLEAQDRLRTVKARYRDARSAFLPELARQCAEAGMPVPREAAEALAQLKTETDR